MTTERGHKYEAIFVNGGCEVRSIDRDCTIAYMQGDEANTLQDEIKAICALDFPRGPFADAESLIDETLSQYAYSG